MVDVLYLALDGYVQAGIFRGQLSAAAYVRGWRVQNSCLRSATADMTVQYTNPMRRCLETGVVQVRGTCAYLRTIHICARLKRTELN